MTPGRGSPWGFLFRRAVFLILDLALVLPLTVLATVSRFFPRSIDVGLGPTPIINAPYHKQALLEFGYSAETFVDSVWHITSDFDYRGDLLLPGPLAVFRPYWLFIRSLFRYRCIYTYFSGGALRTTTLLCWGEAVLLQLADIRTVIMPFGSDVHDLTLCPNRAFVHRMAQSYPTHRFLRGRIRRSIAVWSYFADHIIAGCDWVDYLHYWDTLMVSHFAIATDQWQPLPPVANDSTRPLCIVHAPNHRAIKGTDHLIRAVNDLKAEGVAIELTLMEGRPNHEVRHLIAGADLVVDQLVIGWYAMFAIEAMAMGKPVICHLRADLLRLYRTEGLLQPHEPPLIDADPATIMQVLREISEDRSRLAAVAQAGPTYVERRHSLRAIGAVFERINRSMGLAPDPTRPFKPEKSERPTNWTSS